MGQLLANLGLVKEHLAVLGIPRLLRQEQFDGEVPVARHLDHFPDLTGLARRHVLE